MRILIVYASRHGQTQRVAERLARVTRAAGAETLLHEISTLPRDVQLRTCDVVVLASPIYFGRHAKTIERFVIAQRANLAKVKTAFLSISGAARAAQSRPMAEENAQKFVAKTRWTPDRVELIAGGEAYTRYGFFTMFIMKRLNKKLGKVVDTTRDYEFTDWDAVDRLGRELAGTSAACTSSSTTPLTSVSA